MYFANRRPSMARRAVAVGGALAVHALAVAGFLHVRADRPPEAEAVAVQVAFLDSPQDRMPAPERPKIQLVDVRPVFPELPQIELPIVQQAPAPAAITVSVPPEVAPPAAPPRTPTDAPVVVASVDYLKQIPPVYPRKARRTGTQGTVLLQVLVDTRGNPREVTVHRSSGHDELDVAAREAVQNWLFRPYVDHGVARNALVIVPVEFALSQTIRTASR